MLTAAQSFIDYLMAAHPPRLDAARVLDGSVPFEAFRADVRAALNKALLGMPPAVPPEPRVIETREVSGGIRRMRIEYTAEQGLVTPAYVLIPPGADAHTPTCVAVHGHGYGVREIVGINFDGTERTGDFGYQDDFALKLCQRGLLVIAPELYGFGDMMLEKDRDAKNHWNSSCHMLSTTLLMLGRTMGGVRVNQTLTAVDALRALNVGGDLERLGIMGISGGGLVTSFAAALDDRFKCVVVSGYANTFAGSVLAVFHCVDNFFPGMVLDMEMPALLAAICPRPLLLEAGTKDDIFPIAHVREAYDALCAVYAHQGAPAPVLDAFEGAHSIHGALSYPFMADELNKL